MKTISITRGKRTLTILTVILLSASCLDYTVRTTVNKDGSVFREYTVKGDSASVFSGSLMIPSGDLWQVEQFFEQEDAADTALTKGQYVYKASRTFSNADELNRWLSADTATNRMKVQVKLTRKFKWFYTYYDYTELYPMSFPFQKIPVDSLLTEMEQSVLIDDGKVVYAPDEKQMIWKKDTLTIRYSAVDSVEMNKIKGKIEEKMMYWMTASFVEEFISTLEADFPDSPATSAIRQQDGELTNIIIRKLPFLDFDTLDVRHVVSTGDSLLGTSALQQLYAAHQVVFNPINQKIQLLEQLRNEDEYHQSLTLPGTLFTTNADEIQGSMLKWDFEPNYFLMKDYIMLANSRVANPWIMLLTGIAALLLAGILFLKPGKRITGV